MQVRLTVWMVSLTILALTLAGFGAIVLQNRSLISNEKGQLSTQAEDIALNLDTIQRGGAFPTIVKVAGLTGVSLVPYDASGDLLLGQPIDKITATLPQGLTSSDFPPGQVIGGKAISGRFSSVLFAAASTTNKSIFYTCNSGYTYNTRFERCVSTTARTGALRRPSATGSTIPILEAPGSSCASCSGILVILTSTVDVSHKIINYFLIASAIALAFALILAITISRRITRPLRNAVSTTGRIAHGDLNARVETKASDYPELASLAQSINTMAVNLDHAHDMERNFLLSISHDLRTPLTSIRGYAEAIQEGAIDDIDHAAQVISTESKRLERLVGDLLDLAKLDAHSFSLGFQAVNVSDLVDRVAEGFRPTIQEAGLALFVHASGSDSLEVRADPDRLAQVLANLIENAYKYASGKVTVQATESSGYIVVAVSDDGPGISNADLPHIFERLYSSKRTPTRRAGTGLGLAIVSELLDAMGFTIRVESPQTADGGTMFVITMSPQNGQRAIAERPPPSAETTLRQ